MWCDCDDLVGVVRKIFGIWEELEFLGSKVEF